jgi:hypothetical protein
MKLKKAANTIHGYSRAEVDTFGEERLWQEFGLHRGVLEEGRYFFLGSKGMVGALSGQYRMLFHPNCVSPEVLAKMDPKASLQGPVLGGRASPDVRSAYQAYVEPVRAYLNSDHLPRPRLKLKTKPKLNFADNPGVGQEPVPTKPKIKFRLPIKERTA